MAMDKRALLLGVGLGLSLEVLRQRLWPAILRILGKPLAQNRQGPAVVPESTIRLMTRLAHKHKAINLSQGYPNEPPPREMSRAAAAALLDGRSLEAASLFAEQLQAALSARGLQEPQRDVLSQYSYPYGLAEMRAEIQAYYARYYPGLPADADDNITVVLGATEGFAVAMRAVCVPGDSVVFFEPFHEIYPSQCAIWGLKPRAVTLREDAAAGEWRFDLAQLEAELLGARALLLNTPHNPSGKVFTQEELATMAKLCIKHDVVCITDEIYEHIVFDGLSRTPPNIAMQPNMAERTIVVNSLSKTARATGWRLGWTVTPKHVTSALRGIHDQLVLHAPTALQFGGIHLLKLPDEYFAKASKEYAAKRDLLLPGLRAVGFKVGVIPKGAYYIFADYTSVPILRGLTPTEAAMKMVQEVGVACVPGDNFYLGDSKHAPDLGQKYLRFAFVRSTDLIQDAVARMRERMV